MNKLRDFIADTLKTNTFDISIGDSVKVDATIKEGSKTRVQAFEGVIIAKNGSGVSENFTVRKISHGVGVERIFPVHSPNVRSVTVLSKGRVRRAKLYYLRERFGKNARIKRDLRSKTNANVSEVSN